MDSLKIIYVIFILFPWQQPNNLWNVLLTWKWSHKYKKTKIFLFMLLSFIVILGWLWCCILAPRCQLWQVLEIIPFVQQFRHLSVRNHLSHNMMTEDIPKAILRKSRKPRKMWYKCVKNYISLVNKQTKCCWTYVKQFLPIKRR